MRKIFVVVPVFASMLLLASETALAQAPAEQAAPAQAPVEQAAPPQAGPAEPAPPPPAQPAPRVLMRTSMGDITMELNPERAPITVANFLRYVNEGHFNGTVIYRVHRGFVIQMGSYNADGTAKATHEPIMLEAGNGLSNVRGAVAMARDTPHSATAEFFINLVDNLRLDQQPGNPETGYAVFGQVVSGMDVIDQIHMVPLGDNGPMPGQAPVTPITITSVTVVN
jgi:cyclophilin family peptidyl-prolyl cis-trans isomerase